MGPAHRGLRPIGQCLGQHHAVEETSSSPAFAGSHGYPPFVAGPPSHGSGGPAALSTVALAKVEASAEAEAISAE